jgi:hypothetical protein
MKDVDLTLITKEQLEKLMEYPILRYFKWGHLPENLQMVSQPFADLAWNLIRMEDDGTVTRHPETHEALRKLLEAKDCAVRAAL